MSPIHVSRIILCMLRKNRSTITTDLYNQARANTRSTEHTAHSKIIFIDIQKAFHSALFTVDNECQHTKQLHALPTLHTLTTRSRLIQVTKSVWLNENLNPEKRNYVEKKPSPERCGKRRDQNQINVCCACRERETGYVHEG